MFQVNRNPTTRDLRVFACGLFIGFPAFSLLLLYLARIRPGPDQASPFLFCAAIGLGVAGIIGGLITILAPVIGRKLYIGWMTATLPIGVVMSTLLLSVLYFLMLPLFSLIVRRKDPLRKKLGGASYWEDYKPHEPTIERMRRPF